MGRTRGESGDGGIEKSRKALPREVGNPKKKIKRRENGLRNSIDRPQAEDGEKKMVNIRRLSEKKARPGFVEKKRGG